MAKRARATPGDASDPHGFPALATAYLEWMAARNYAEATLRSREKLLRFLVEWAELRGLTRPAQFTRPILERYQRYLFHYRQPNGRPLSFASQAQRLMPVRLFFRWLARRNLILSNPAADLELPRKEYRLPKAVLSAQEADRVIDSLQATQPMALRDRAILEVLYSTGMRRKELVGLRLHDVDAERSTVFIRQGKGKKDRIVPIGERALHWLSRYLEELRPRLLVPPDDGYVFLSEAGGPLSAGRLTDLVKRIVARSGVGKSGSCHLFRHTMATLMLENGADIRYIQQMLGHASLSSTEIYTHVSIAKLQEIHRATHPARRQQAASPAGERPSPDSPPPHPTAGDGG